MHEAQGVGGMQRDGMQRETSAVRTQVAARDNALDGWRGLVMVLMVLDHARDFWLGYRVHPLDLATTTPVLFATRWVTHFCAPVFILAAGMAAYLYGAKHGAAERTRFLLTRGLFLVLLELTVIRLLWIPDPFYHFTLLQVIWVLGWSMIVLAALARAPAGCGVGALRAWPNQSTAFTPTLRGVGSAWNLLHERAILTLARTLFSSPSARAWIGVWRYGLRCPVSSFRRSGADATRSLGAGHTDVRTTSRVERLGRSLAGRITDRAISLLRPQL